MQEKEVTDLRIYNVSAKTNEALNNIAEHKGMTKTAFLKSEIKSLIDKYPHYAAKPLDRD